MSPDPTFGFEGDVESFEVVVVLIVGAVEAIVLGFVEDVVVVVVAEVADFFNLEVVGEVVGEAFFASFSFSFAGAFLVT